jgi:hypothetical protein
MKMNNIKMPTFLEYEDILNGLTKEEWRNERSVTSGKEFIQVVYKRDNPLEIKLLDSVIKDMEKERMSILKSLLSIEARREQILIWKTMFYGKKFVEDRIAKGRKVWEIELPETDVGKVSI